MNKLPRDKPSIEKLIDRKLDQLTDLTEQTFLSDQELEQVTQLRSELNTLWTQYRKISPNMDESRTKDYQDLINAEIKQSAKEKPPKETKHNDIDPKYDKHTADYELKSLKQKLEHYKTLEQIEKTKEKIRIIEKNLREQQDDATYLQSKKDKQGIITFNEDLYQERLKPLKEQLKEAKTFKEKFNIRMKILNLNSVKAQTKLSNGMIKAPKAIAKVTSMIGEVSNSMAEMGDQFNTYSDYDKPTKNKKKKGKKKKNKTSSTRSKGYAEDYSMSNDFGFNTKDMFG